ncbi:MAG: phosphoglucosamine mutase [Bacteroidales bacterium]|nr:MAG: phosphoglucosamine mutase [Bacteroidales bacterium]
MTLIKSIAGIRGTIGGYPGEGLNPADIVKFATGYAAWLSKESDKEKLLVLMGRDARISGQMVSRILSGTLLATGIDVVDLGVISTPAVEIAVREEKAAGGVIITASHNPMNWNAFKLLNSRGELVDETEGKEILSLAEKDYSYSDATHLGGLKSDDSYTKKHIAKILELPLVDRKAISSANFRIVVDGINSVGGIAVPLLLETLGVRQIVKLNCDPDGLFSRDPEPLPENLEVITETVKKEVAHLGLVVDPDVDRLVIVNEDGSMFGEEYTIVAVADYILQNTPGNTVTNLSSSQALREITERYGFKHYFSAVGEVNVVKVMREKNAVIGGEGNGGVIYPDLHYGRDALVGIALFLTYLAKSGMSCSGLRGKFPDYYISKKKIESRPGMDPDHVLKKLKERFREYTLNDIDGLKIEIENDWVHLRKSNTEPIIRIYAESNTPEAADLLTKKFIREIESLLSSSWNYQV